MIGLVQPWVLAGLLALPIYAFLRHRRIRQDAVAYPPLQYRSPTDHRQGWARLRLPLEVLILALVLLALAGPYREHEIELMDDPGIDVVLALDVSLSMLAEDFPPTRLAALQQTARDFLARSASHRVGLVIFAGDAFVQSPLTTDRKILKELLEGVTVYTIDQNKSGGTAIGDALLVAGERLRKSRPEEPVGDQKRDQAIVLITDGESNLGIDPVLAARHVKDLGIRLYVIGIGGTEPMQVSFEGRQVGGDTPYLAVLDDQQLEEVAEAADGRYFRAIDVDALSAVFGELSRLESSPLENRKVTIRNLGTSWIALVLLVLFMAHLFLAGMVVRRPLR